MKIIITTTSFILLFFFSAVLAQELSQMEVVGNGRQQLDEIVSNDIRDVNGNVCAGIIISSDLTGLTYTAYNGIVKLKRAPGNDFLFLSPNERVVEIFKNGFESLKIILSDYDVKLNSGEVWQIKVTGDKKLDLIPINIITNIEGAEIFIDGVSKGIGKVFQVAPGQHEIRLEKEGYQTKTENITVSINSTLFDMVLQPVELKVVTIKSIPTGARIFVDNNEIGFTDKADFYMPGEHELRISKSGYLDINDTINILPTGKNEFNYQLVKNSVTLTLNISPIDATVLINKKDYSNRQQIELAPGKYFVEINKDGFESKSEYIELSLSKSVTKTIKLTEKTGTLQVTVQPLDAKITLKRNGSIFESWEGANIVKNIGVGSYTLEVTKQGYITLTKTIQIKEDESTTEDIILDEGLVSKSPFDNEGDNDKVFVQPKSRIRNNNLLDILFGVASVREKNSRGGLTFGLTSILLPSSSFESDNIGMGGEIFFGIGPTLVSTGLNHSEFSNSPTYNENDSLSIYQVYLQVTMPFFPMFSGKLTPWVGAGYMLNAFKLSGENSGKLSLHNPYLTARLIFYWGDNLGLGAEYKYSLLEKENYYKQQTLSLYFILRFGKGGKTND